VNESVNASLAAIILSRSLTRGADVSPTRSVRVRASLFVERFSIAWLSLAPLGELFILGRLLMLSCVPPAIRTVATPVHQLRRCLSVGAIKRSGEINMMSV